ncbi:single-stranded DNA-binding protein [Nocardia sp. NBC_00565]|uniref:single-stranded DNA-binding protein n=1 Tax=Nocardia sp. NBC_00565 TaxID=2975993 RepID=UPI002E7FC73F|nr:single-stranded DNA-binding protein [Nocardia sp. NBC_00565]WUC03612.1 single-stranded DNA-binding protein [Nocardia sp. NBC_00565]
MYEAMATVIGNVVTHPVRRDLTNGEQVVTFRMASNSRRFDVATGEWVDGGTLYLTVSCWRRLVLGVEASVRRGDPIIAHGQLRSHEYRSKDGVERRDLEMRATAIGPDLSRCTAEVVRRTASGGGSGPSTLARNSCDRSSTDDRARVDGEGPGEGATSLSSAPPRGTDPDPVNA